jgi:hypothetical protein
MRAFSKPADHRPLTAYICSLPASPRACVGKETSRKPEIQIYAHFRHAAIGAMGPVSSHLAEAILRVKSTGDWVSGTEFRKRDICRP